MGILLKTYLPLALSLITCTFSKIVASKGELRQLTSNKEFINRLPEGQFEVVHPFQVRDKNERIGIDTRNYFLNGTVHYKQVIIVIRSTYNGRLKLLLGLNDLLFVNGTVFKKLESEGDHLFTKKVENCYYQGTVNGEESSFVALSTCRGLRGIISFENGSSYGIWPLDGGERGRRHPHVLYRTRRSQTASCGSQASDPLNLQNQYRRKRDVTKQTKYVELALIGDSHFMKAFDLSEEGGTAYMFEAVNIADYIFARDLNIRLSVVYMEQWLGSSRISYHDDIERTLSSVVEYVTGEIYQIAKDCTLLFTVAKFVNDEVTSSTQGSICTSRATGLITAVDTYTVHDTGQAFAHNLAHILGLNHDTNSCACEGEGKCIMHKSFGEVGSSFLWQFSKCSLARMHSTLQAGHLQCLLNKPLQASTLQHCGNGIVDGDEDCDCGPREKCDDQCCDPLTCKLRANARCASHQTCCYRCQLRPAGHVCRQTRSACDVAETCSGEHGDCPEDGYLTDGTACGISGQCWKGTCADSELQCRSLWGEDATTADEQCYKRNGLGLEYGSCGKDRDGVYKKCSIENIHCGTLHCRNGTQTPSDPKLNSFNLQFSHESEQVQCKTVTDVEVGLVKDGSKCGTGKVCVQGICLPLMQVSPSAHCPSNNLAFQCSGHGDCTTTQRCICYKGWVGKACDRKLNISSSGQQNTQGSQDIVIPSLAAGHTLDTTTLLAILLLVGVLLLLLLVCLLFCYRRRSDAGFSSSVDDKLQDRIPDKTERAIKFGSMPSYREEKRKRKKDKHVYDALHRINEASEERDSTSLKSHDVACEQRANELTENGTAFFYKSTKEDLVTAVLHGSSTTVLRRDERGLFSDGELYGSFTSSNAGSQPVFHNRCPSLAPVDSRCRGGYATDSELTDGLYNARYSEPLSAGTGELSPTSSQDSVSRATPTPLRLNNIGMLLRQLQYSDDITSEAEMSAVEADRADLVSNAESSRGYEPQETNSGQMNPARQHFNSHSERVSPKGSKELRGYYQSNDHLPNGTFSSEKLLRNSDVEHLHNGSKKAQEHSQSSLFSDTFRLDV